MGRERLPGAVANPVGRSVPCRLATRPESAYAVAADAFFPSLVSGSPAMTTRLSLFLFLAFGLAAASIASSCGSSRCGPGMCAGCCDSSGACVGGSEAAACGTSGAACSACTGGTCNAGTCSAADAGSGGGAGGGTADAGACGNCNGCCQNGVCRAGSATNACGAAGATCVDCISQNRICVSGQCQTQCGPANCATGCCQNNMCVTMTTAMTCGRGGEACVRCQAMEACVVGVCGLPDGGSSADDGGLSDCARTCTGCCDPGAVCRSGNVSFACGSQGNACLTCTTSCQSVVSGGGRCL